MRNLVRLNIEDNSLKVIDLSSVPFLTSLDISNNLLT
jgi:Leucine-rich repeat (LRR) protein